VAAALKGLEVGVLVNNVGQSYNFPMYFDELSDEQARTHITGLLIIVSSTLY
jgi:short-subunit dehydrogenase